MVYYNEFDPKAAAWLRELIKMGMIADGIVDDRSIVDVDASDLKGFTQHHFFAGIGVWSYALRRAGWKDDRHVCTASLPCQPFSAAGKHKGKDDERHLLPHFIELVKQCGFDTIFGEQVEGAIRHGWLDDLQTVMEGEGYAIGHCVLGAHSVNAAHQRQRLFWVAHTKNGDRWAEPQQPTSVSRKTRNEPGRDGSYSGVADSSSKGLQGHGRPEQINDKEGWSQQNGQLAESSINSEVDWLYCRDNKYRPIKSGIKPLVNGLARGVVYSGGEIDPNNTAYARTIRLKGYGNAINADVAAEFIQSYMEIH